MAFFRQSIERKVAWAGKPIKKLESGLYGPRLTPRGSFAAYLEKQGKFCEPWSDMDLAAAAAFQLLLIQLATHAEEARAMELQKLLQHQRQKDLLIAELNHRVKNILALIKSLSRRAKESSDSIESYALALEQRISALAKAHDLALDEAGAGILLKALLESELAPYTMSENAQVLVAGPSIGLRSDVAPILSLVFHELSTNAAKYGALSTGDGIVKINWSQSDDTVTIIWHELNGPPVEAPKRKGFGYTLIEKVVPYEFDGEVNLEFQPTGVKLQIRLANEYVTQQAHNPLAEAKMVRPGIPITQAADGKCVLIVEDNAILALDLADSIQRLGASDIITVGSVEKALSQVKAGGFDFAIMDVKLRGQTSFEVASILAETGVPFIFATGYGSKIAVPEQLAHIKILTKPVDDFTLSDALARLLN